MFEDTQAATDVDTLKGVLTIGDVDITLPVSDDAEIEILPTGDVLFSDDELDLAPIGKDDGSVQVTFVLEDSSAPDRFDFGLGNLDGAQPHVQPDGAVLCLAADGSLVVGAAAPWALDAEGKPVPTHFEVDGATLTQVVSHRGVDAIYPVVADPWLGVALFSKVTVDTYNKEPRVNAFKSAWGQAMHTPTPQGVMILDTAGWNELKAKASVVTTKLTMRQQYGCHVAGGYGHIAGKDWNLEMFRPNRTVSWTWGVHVHHCNWTTPNRY